MPNIDVNIRDAVQIGLKDSKEPVVVEQERKDVEVQINESSPEVLVEHRPRKYSIIVDDAESEEALAGTLPMYTLDEYNALKQSGRLENKMYCIYNKGMLTRIYIYKTLIAKRANEGQIATGSTFPIIFPIIFA